jgi:outer membrane protein TolC
MRVPCVAIALLFTATVEAKPERSWVVGIVADGPGYDEALAAAIAEVTRGESGLVVSVPTDKRSIGDFTREGAKVRLDALLADKGVDLVVAAGPLVSDVAVRSSPGKPVVASQIIDVSAQGAPFASGTSGKKNVTYVVSPDETARDLAAIVELLHAKKVAVVLSAAIAGGLPSIPTMLAAQGSKLGITVEVAPVRGDASAIGALGADVGAAYFYLLDSLDDAARDRLAEAAMARRLPTFSHRGRKDVEKNVLATIVSHDNAEQRARRVALNVLRIVLGEDPSTFQVAISRDESSVINMRVARAIGFVPTWTVLTESELIDARMSKAQAEKVTLRTAVEQMLAANLDLEAEGKKVEAGSEDELKAIAPLLPQIQGTLTAAIIDQDRARAAFGLYPERSMYAGGEVKQVIVAEQLWANVSIQGDLQTTRELQRDLRRLELVHETAQAYLNVLRTKTLEKIRLENVRRTRSHLELARSRAAIGSGGPADVHRWEYQIATDRRTAIQANSIRNLSEIALNRMRHRPLEESFQTEEGALESGELAFGFQAMGTFLDNPVSFAIFRDFMVDEGLRGSPELAALDKAIAAQERFVTSSLLAIFLPTIGASFDIRHRFFEDGEGVGPPDLMLPPGLPPIAFPVAGKTQWTFGVGLSLPVFDGLDNIASLGKAEAELEQRRLERSAAAEKVEQRVRSVVHQSGASYAGIRLTKDGAEAAKKGLDIVTNAYAEGAIGTLDLLDAQNAHVVSEQLAADAFYEFVLDHLAVQRSIGWYAFLEPERAADWMKRFVAYHDERKKREAK